MGENQKNDDSSSLLKVFLDLGVLSEAMLAHLGAMLGDLGAILEQLGDKMWTESAKMSQDSGQERQDEARWRKWLAREKLQAGTGMALRRDTVGQMENSESQGGEIGEEERHCEQICAAVEF